MITKCVIPVGESAQKMAVVLETLYVDTAYLQFFSESSYISFTIHASKMKDNKDCVCVCVQTREQL